MRESSFEQNEIEIIHAELNKPCDVCGEKVEECSCKYCENCNQLIKNDEKTIIVSYKRHNALIHEGCEEDFWDEINYQWRQGEDDLRYGDFDYSMNY